MRILLFTPITVQVEAAKRLGYHVTSVWHRYSGPNFFEKIIVDVGNLSDVFIEGDMFTETDWLDQVAAVFRDHPDTLLIPGVPDDFLEPFLRAAARVDRLPNPLSSYEHFKSKASLRELLSVDAKLRVGHKRIDTFSDLKTELANIKCKSILKPAISSGSKNICKIETAADATEALRKWEGAREPLNLILEDFLEGPQFSVEVISRDGQHEVMGITEKFPVHAPHYIENGGLFPAAISAALALEIIEVTTQFLEMTGFKSGPTHTEVIADSTGVKIVESNMRMGGLIPFLIQGAHGNDANEFLLEFLSGRVAKYEPKKQDVAVLGILDFGTSGRLVAVGGQAEVRSHPNVIKMNVWARLGQVLSPVTNNEQRHGYVVVSGESLAAAFSNMNQVKEILRPEVEGDCLTLEKSIS